MCPLAGSILVEPLQKAWADGKITQTESQQLARLLLQIRKEAAKREVDQLAAQAVETASQTVQTFDLSRAKLPAIPFSTRIKSHTRKSEFYKVDLSGPSCSCPDFRSPSGWEVKAVFSILPDASKHASSYLAVERHVEATYGQAIDSPCKDSVRLCFVSDDPDIFIRQDNAQVLHPLESEPQPGFPSGNEEEPKDAGQWNKDSIEQTLGSTGVILPSGHTSFSESAARLFIILAKTGRFFFSGKRVCSLADDSGHLSLEVVADNQFRSAIEDHGSTL